MRCKEVAVLSLSAAALLVAGGGNAHADNGSKFVNKSQILSCVSLEVLDIPIASTANNSIDCSENDVVKTHEQTTVVETAEKTDEARRPQ